MNPYKANLISEAEKIDSRIAEKSIVDYGIVTAVSSNRVDVNLQAKATAWGEDVGIVELKSVELLFPVSSGLSFEMEVKVGDSVLLLGLKNYVQSVASITEPAKPEMPFKYSRENIKAVPLSSLRSIGSSTGQSSLYMRAKAGKLQVKNATKSLYTALDSFETAIQTFSSSTSQASLTAGAGSSASLASALNVLLASMNASIATAKADLASIMEA